MIRKFIILVFAGILLAGCVTDQPVESGTIHLTSSPSGAEIYLDNQYRGTTPATIPDVVPGSHTIEFRMKGYKSWKSTVTIPPGISNYVGTLSAQPASEGGTESYPTVTTEPASVTVRVSRDQIIVGDSIMFSGLATGMDKVKITLFGPGKYSDGVVLENVQPDVSDAWRYTWNPGTAIKSGTYTVVVSNAGNTVSDRAQFTAIGDGVVSVAPSSYAIEKGATVTISGRCTTGAPVVNLVLFGPERYGSGVDLGTFSVMGDQTWGFRYTTDSTMPTGIYTLYASDVPKTTQGTAQFTIGYAS